MDTQNKLSTLWTRILQEEPPLTSVVVSAKTFFQDAVTQTTVPTKELIQKHNVWKDVSFESVIRPIEESEITDENNYSHKEVVALDKKLTDRFHQSISNIIYTYPKFIDQLRYIHFSNMNGNEDVLLYPSQTKRLVHEGVESIAGQIRTIQTGFGDYRFNGPSVPHLKFLLSQYTEKIEALLPKVPRERMYEFVSFAQYYFALIHPFYERCGRTSEELMYVLFAKHYPDMTRYISKTGWRESPLANERMLLINTCAENFNKRIASTLGLDPEEIIKTPDIYRAMSKYYFPKEADEIYIEGFVNPPFYYNHPLKKVLESYYFTMESMLFDEIKNYTPSTPPPHIVAMGEHLEFKGHKHYTFQKEKSEEGGTFSDPTSTPGQS